MTNITKKQRHNPHAHRMLQLSAAYLLAQTAQTGPQHAKSLWLIPAQPHGAKNAHRASGTAMPRNTARHKQENQHGKF